MTRHLVLTALVTCATVLPALAQGRAEVATFDSSSADVRCVGGRWSLIANGKCLKDLGTSETDARAALRLVRELRLTQYGSIGTPRSVMEYWLADGQPPRGLPTGLRQLPFEPESLRVEPFQGSWCLRDAQQLLFNFGSAADDARQALQVIQRYGFNRIAYLGEPVPVMMCLFSSHDAAPFLDTPIPGNTQFGATVPGEMSMPAAALPPGAVSPVAAVGLPPALSFGSRFTTLSSTEPNVANASVPFDWRQAQLQHGDQGCKLVAGGRCVANFGGNEQAASEALRMVQFYRVTEFCRIGRENMGFTYFLVAGQAPRGLMVGTRSVAFRPETLTVQQLPVGWVIGDGNQPLLLCGNNFEEAARALEALQRHQFDHLCRIGDGAAELTFLVREH